MSGAGNGHAVAPEPPADFARDFTALARDPQRCVLQLSKVEAWMLLGQLQLALRHPQNTGPTAPFARALAETIVRAVATTPALKRVAQAGWDPAQDVPR